MELVDVSKLEGLEKRHERINGVDAQVIAISDAERAAEALGGDAAALEGLEELTVWLAEDGGWPVALRMIISNGDYPFQRNSDDRSEDPKTVPDKLPPDLFESYQYDWAWQRSASQPMATKTYTAPK